MTCGRLPRLLIEPESIQHDVVELSAPQAYQLSRVLRLRAGDRVRVFDGREPFDMVIELRGPTSGAIVDRCTQPAEPRHSLIAYPALLQRDKFETVLQKLTEVGVAAIAPVLTRRGLVRSAPDAQRLTRWQAIVREATEQCGRGRVPQLLACGPFEDGVRSAAADSRVVLAYEGEHHATLEQALENAPERLSLFVGPEGGYEAEEVDFALGHGAKVVTLGPRILRTETASPIFAALVLYELGDLSSGA